MGRQYKASLWWKDVASLGVITGVEGDWTQNAFIKKLGCGGSTRFWLDRWVGVAPLCVTFPCLFRISLQPELLIKDMGGWDSEHCHRKLEWRQNFFSRELEPFRLLMELIHSVPLKFGLRVL
ncbi:tropinone reductase I [Trifolium repens]|nr:tropinone reductase I [Trifolium repens]